MIRLIVCKRCNKVLAKVQQKNVSPALVLRTCDYCFEQFELFRPCM
jgi:phage FluMu protein Com